MLKHQKSLIKIIIVLASAAHILKLERYRDGPWPLRKDDMQIREAFHKKKKKGHNKELWISLLLSICSGIFNYVRKKKEV